MKTDKNGTRYYHSVLRPRRGGKKERFKHPLVNSKSSTTKPAGTLCVGCKHDIPGDCRNKRMVDGYWRFPDGDCYETNA